MIAHSDLMKRNFFIYIKSQKLFNFAPILGAFLIVGSIFSTAAVLYGKVTSETSYVCDVVDNL